MESRLTVAKTMERQREQAVDKRIKTCACLNCNDYGCPTRCVELMCESCMGRVCRKATLGGNRMWLDGAPVTEAQYEAARQEKIAAKRLVDRSKLHDKSGATPLAADTK